MESIGIVYEDSFKLHFSQLPWDYYVKKYIDAIDHIDASNKNIASMFVEVEFIDKVERETLLNGGNLTPAILFYWTDMYYELLRILNREGYHCGWINVEGTEIDDADFSSMIALMTTTMWENNLPNLYFWWGRHQIKDVLKYALGFEGVLMPAADGYGIIAVLNDEDYLLLKKFFPVLHDKNSSPPLKKKRINAAGPPERTAVSGIQRLRSFLHKLFK